MGVPVFPCGTDKAPLVATGFHAASTDPDAVRSLFAGHGENIFIGGAMGGDAGLFACDFDTYKSGAAGASAAAFMAELEALDMLPPTQRHRTKSGGLHLIYESHNGYPNCKPVPGVEIKGEGGYIILPPSAGYTIEDNGGFSVAPKALVERLIHQKKQHTAKTVSQHEDAIMRAVDFHDSVASMVAKLFRQGQPASAVMARVLAALGSSVAASPQHPRHARWLAIMQDDSGELARMVGSGRDKFDLNAATQDAADSVDPAVAERLKRAAAAAGFYASSDTAYSPAGGIAPPPKDYGDAWPFADDGYFAHEDIDVANQKFTIYPVYCENESVVIAADPKAGKTAISLKLAFALALGKSMGPFRITEPRGVLYFSLEGTRAVKLRLEAEKRFRRDAGETLPDKIPFFVIEKSANFITQQDELVGKIVAADKWYTKDTGQQLGLIVVDTLTKAMPGADQNSVDDTSKLFELTSKLRDHGVTATVVYIHHTGKDGRTRGSSNIEAEVDVVLKVHKQEDGSSLLSIFMARSIDDVGMYRFELQSYDLGETTQGIKQTAPVAVLTETKEAQGEVTEDARRAHVIRPWLKMLVSAGPGRYDMGKLLVLAKTARLMAGRQRRADMLKVLDTIFNRETSVVHAGHVMSVETDGDSYVAVTVQSIG